MENSKFTDVVILAGGVGERLWPASKPEYPKQFMALPNGRSLLQETLLRALSLEPDGKILIITKKDLLVPMSEHCKRLSSSLTASQKEKLSKDLYILAEPFPKHTCAPLMLACSFLEKISGKNDNTILVLASDHVIEPIDAFASDCGIAAECAENGNFVCFAIPPTEASTGYGYIKKGADLEGFSSSFKIDRFKEKPDYETAKSYIESGEYFWNSGMFGFTRSLFESELKTCEPKVYDAFDGFKDAELPEEKSMNGVKYIDSWDAMQDAYEKTLAIAVDNAIAERTTKAAAVKARFNWDDVGSWDAFEKLFDKNDEKTVEIKSGNNFVYSDIPVALCGVEDLVVVIKNGNALVMKKGSSNMMRDVVKNMKEVK